jgi:hypothetical protein
VESSQKGFFFWPLLRFNFHEHCPSGSEMSSWILILFRCCSRSSERSRFRCCC